MKKYYLIFLAIIIPGLFLRDFTPMNELRYLSIADEALNNHTFFTFYNHGIPYADKPPLYLWIVMLGKWLFNSHNLVFLALFSIIPALIILNVMNKWTFGQISNLGRAAGCLILMSTSLFSILATSLRMDILMTMFIVLSLDSFYSLYKKPDKLTDRILLPIWMFLAVFSKGPMGLLIPLLSIIVFLSIKKELKTFLLYIGPLTGVILAVLFGFWFLMVFKEGGLTYLNNLLFNQTINRAVNAFTHNKPFYYYLLHVWYILFPWSILIIGTIILQTYHKLIKSDLEKLFLTVILTTFFLLSLISSKLSVYLFPALPFMVYLSLIGMEKPELQTKLKKIFKINIVVSFLIIPLLALLTLEYFETFNIKYYIYTCALLILLTFLIYSLKRIRKESSYSKIIFLSLSFLVITQSLIQIPITRKMGYKQLCQEVSSLAIKYEKKDLFFYKIKRGQNMDAYLKQSIHEIKEADILSLKNKEGIFFCKKTEINKNPVLEKVIEGKTFVVKGDYIIVVI
jgi:4-amino-4-deoxy-L-arabinose transferase-like glycosyltransferase